MTATTSSALAYSFFILCTKNIPLTVFILVTLFLLTSFVWTSKRELILDIESKRPDGDHTSTGKIESLPLISHLRPKAGDRIRSLHRRLITSCGCSAPIYLPIDIKRYSTKDSELSAVHGTENNCHEPCPPTFAERPSSLLLYGSKPGLDSVGRYEGGYVEGVLQTALIRCMLRRPGSSMSFLPF
ncbi:uncharacterized protein EV420DRAFT_1592888 [Desarmillaria tabescens]|uniref:Uncharacterized protein n=1 Tax=Armillaria tabescens TaxID=1929756 RepID=A0AA39MII3_ARMTA|nr:uncharacterized protein EV420DRAFT_1592888 [Desarmillaria tabescens]KAK0435587.1 hypothetical protein EV420DRAFT_1592888 [Desarmillaria tabescens]